RPRVLARGARRVPGPPAHELLRMGAVLRRQAGVEDQVDLGPGVVRSDAALDLSTDASGRQAHRCRPGPPQGVGAAARAALTPSLPLRRRPVDWVFLAFWVVNAGFITPMVDLEQIVIADPARFDYPAWPPRFAVDAIHWWARTFDPVVWHRAPWYRA